VTKSTSRRPKWWDPSSRAISSVARIISLRIPPVRGSGEPIYRLLPTLTNTDSPCPASCRHPRLKMRVKSKMCMIGHRAAGRSRTASLGIQPESPLPRLYAGRLNHGFEAVHLCPTQPALGKSYSASDRRV
jgi:hypothetical protein